MPILVNKLVPAIKVSYGGVYENSEKDIYGEPGQVLPQRANMLERSLTMKQRLKKGILTGMNTISINFQVMGENNVGLILQQVGAPYLAPFTLHYRTPCK